MMEREENKAGDSDDGRGGSVREKKAGSIWCAIAYVSALAAAFAAGWVVRDSHPLAVVAVADATGTMVVFAFSMLFNNSSFYDPYWSVAPPAIAVYWLSTGDAGTPLIRRVLLCSVVLLWGVRLTYNWARGWRGLKHEDWRYVDIRNATGRGYWPASFLSIHFLPTTVVYAGCLAFYPALGLAGRPFNFLDVAGFVVCIAAVWIEAAADKQLHRFVSTREDPLAILETGLWAYSRHPNYFGEVLFWWGVFLFAIAARPDMWWIIAGPVAMTLLFLFISIPLIDTRMLKRRPQYRERMKRVSRLIPWFFTRGEPQPKISGSPNR